MAHDALAAAPVQEQNQRLGRLLRRTSFLMYELDARHTLRFASQTFGDVLGM